MDIIFDLDRCPTYPTWRHPGLLTLGPPYPNFEHEKCRLIITASSHGNAFASLAICEVNPPVTSGPHGKGTVTFFVIREKVIYQKIEIYVIWDTTTFILRYCNDAWAVLMWSILWFDSYTKLYVHDSMRPVHLAPEWQITCVPFEHLVYMANQDRLNL